MTVIVIDSSTIISCAVNCMLWVFDELKAKGVRFVVPAGVKHEVIDSGLSSQKFKLEAIRVMHHFSNKTFEEYDGDLKAETSRLLGWSNSSFYIRNKQLSVLQDTDVQVAVLAKKIGADAILTDERTLRLFIENPDSIKKFLESKFHEKVTVNENALHSFTEYMHRIPVMRSAELIVYSFENGIFDPTLKRCATSGIPNCQREVISGLLFALKFAGCAISFEEVNDYVNLVMRKKR